MFQVELVTITRFITSLPAGARRASAASRADRQRRQGKYMQWNSRKQFACRTTPLVYYTLLFEFEMHEACNIIIIHVLASTIFYNNSSEFRIYDTFCTQSFDTYKSCTFEEDISYKYVIIICTN